MRKGIKARPHDIEDVMKMNPEMIEIHASSEDLDKEINGHFDVPLAVHLPEYSGSDLIDPASLDEEKRYRAVEFYKRAADISRKWGAQFRGTPKVIMHPGGWSSESQKISDRLNLYNQFATSMSDINFNGFDFLVENMPPHPWFFGGQWYCSIFMDPRECLDYCLGNGWGLCLDLCHAYLWCSYMKMPEKIFDFVKKVKPVTAHIHISDARGVDGEGLQIGDGNMPLRELIEMIHKIQIGVVPEIWLGHREGFSGFKTAWERIDAMIPVPA